MWDYATWLVYIHGLNFRWIQALENRAMHINSCEISSQNHLTITSFCFLNIRINNRSCNSQNYIHTLKYYIHCNNFFINFLLGLIHNYWWSNSLNSIFAGSVGKWVSCSMGRGEQRHCQKRMGKGKRCKKTLRGQGKRASKAEEIQGTKLGP